MTVPGVGREETAHGSWSALAADVSALTAWLTEQGLSISAGPGAVLKALAPVLDRLTRERDRLAWRLETMTVVAQGNKRHVAFLTQYAEQMEVERNTAQAAWESCPHIPLAEHEELRAERDRLADDLDNARESAASILLAGDEIARHLIAVRAQLAERTAERDRLAGAIRRYEPVIEAAKVLAVTAWNSTAPHTPVFEAFLTAVAALGDGPSLPPKAEQRTETGDADG